jgi:Ca2+-binding EF-hand superfamily protein
MFMRSLFTTLVFTVAVGAFCIAAQAGDQPKPYDPRAAFAETDTNHDGEIDLEEFHERIVEVFYSADTNKDGFLSVEEYAQLPFSGSFKDADTDGDGRISLHEFVAIRYRQFVAADTNHDGALTVDEVVAVYEGKTSK